MLSEGQSMKKPKLRPVKSNTTQGGTVANQGNLVRLIRRPKIVPTKP